jgi:phosphate transport system protein
MRIHFQRDLEKLKERILEMSAEVEITVAEAVRAVESRDAVLARSVLDRETRTNAREVDVEEECLKILALHQPVAADLRYLVSVLKINHDLERIGDLAEHIAEAALLLCDLPPVAVPPQLGEMAAKSRLMLRRVLDAFFAVDARAAASVREEDDALDALNRLLGKLLKAEMVRDPARLEPLLKLMHIARHLERIGDHATNIAEDLIYLVEGRIVRHTAAAESQPPRQ